MQLGGGECMYGWSRERDGRGTCGCRVGSGGTAGKKEVQLGNGERSVTYMRGGQAVHMRAGQGVGRDRGICGG